MVEGRAPVHLFDAHRLHVDVEGGDGVGEARDTAFVLLQERERARLAVLDDALDHRALQRLVRLRKLLAQTLHRGEHLGLVLGAAAHVLLVEPPHLLREFLRRRRQIFGLRRRRDLLAHPLFGGADRRLRRLDGAPRRRLRLVGLRALLARHLDQARLHRRQLLAQPRLALAARLLELRARVDAGLVDEPRLLGELRRRCLLRFEGGAQLVAFLDRVLQPRAQLGDLAVELQRG